MTSTTKQTKKAEPRIARLMQVGQSQVLALTCGKGTTFYRLVALDHGFGEAAFRLSKADNGNGAGEQYDVLLDGARSSCECKGFLRWHHCKHVESLEKLVAAGKLPACKVEKPARVVNTNCCNCRKPIPECACTV